MGSLQFEYPDGRCGRIDGASDRSLAKHAEEIERNGGRITRVFDSIGALQANNSLVTNGRDLDPPQLTTTNDTSKLEALPIPTMNFSQDTEDGAVLDTEPGLAVNQGQEGLALPTMNFSNPLTGGKPKAASGKRRAGKPRREVAGLPLPATF